MAQRKLPQPRTQAAVLTGADLRTLRESVGISQSELSRRLHYHRSYVSYLERGRGNISLTLAKALLDLLSDLQGQMTSERERLTKLRQSLLHRAS